VVLGDSGGLTEDNLTAFLLFAKDRHEGIALDAGSLMAGIRAGVGRGAFNGFPTAGDAQRTPEGQILQSHIKGYLISHAHLDHTAGLVINATDDVAKPIYGLPSTLAILQEHIFNWRVWPNFSSEGAPPALSRYALTRLVRGEMRELAGTPLKVTAFPLSHGHAYESTAFLVDHAGESLLYLGDTGPDAVEGTTHLKALWTSVAPLIRDRRLHAIFMEASYANDRPDKELFGHLTPHWVNQELRVLASLVDERNPEKSLHGLTVVITHIKPALTRGETPRARIERELKEENPLGVRFVLARQGDKLTL